MIRISRYLYINILTIILFIICTFTHTVDVLCITYLVMFLHECAHLIAAACIGLKVSHISLQPFGVNLKLKNKIVSSLSDEIILYLSGPLFNALLALLAAVVYLYFPNDDLRFFYITNLTLFVMNMLPSAPLDGGIILKKVLMYAAGFDAARKVSRVISALCAVCVMALGVYVFYKSGRNFSLMLFSALMIGNIFTQGEKYNTDFVRELMFSGRKKARGIHHIIVTEDTDCTCIAKKFRPSRHNVVYMTHTSGKITRIMTDTQIIGQLLDK